LTADTLKEVKKWTKLCPKKINKDGTVQNAFFANEKFMTEGG
jgi:hypothetical protein